MKIEITKAARPRLAAPYGYVRFLTVSSGPTFSIDFDEIADMFQRYPKLKRPPTWILPIPWGRFLEGLAMGKTVLEGEHFDVYREWSRIAASSRLPYLPMPVAYCRHC